jgi:hypothetical protein
MESVKIIKTLAGEFVSSEVVKAGEQREYNQSEWNKAVNRYSEYAECKFFKVAGNIYEFDYYVIYIADGIRFLGEVTYGGSMTNGGFAFGFFTEGIKDKGVLAKLKDYPELKGMGEDSLTILAPGNDTRIGTHGAAREWMRKQTMDIKCRFFTKQF